MHLQSLHAPPKNISLAPSFAAAVASDRAHSCYSGPNVWMRARACVQFFTKRRIRFVFAQLASRWSCGRCGGCCSGDNGRTARVAHDRARTGNGSSKHWVGTRFYSDDGAGRQVGARFAGVARRGASLLNGCAKQVVVAVVSHVDAFCIFENAVAHARRPCGGGG